VAKLALARAHGHGRVALRELDRVEPLCDRTLHVLVGHVLTDADEAFPLRPGAVVGRCGNRGRTGVARYRADRFDVLRQIGGDEDATARVVLDPRAGLREEGVGRLASARDHEQVAVDGTAVELHASHLAEAAARHNLSHPLAAKVDDLGYLGSGPLQVFDH
jgi:hypothetical protein